MSNYSVIARPYAQAVFDLANDAGQLDEWSGSLNTLSDIVKHPDLMVLINDPRIGRDQICNLVLELGGESFNKSIKNLIRILSHYRRLPAVPTIARQYESLRAQEEGIVEAELETAYELDEQQKSNIIAALEQKLNRKVRLSTEVNESLIGGAVVRTGDWVIDGSIRGRLDQLSSSLGV